MKRSIFIILALVFGLATSGWAEWNGVGMGSGHKN